MHCILTITKKGLRECNILKLIAGTGMTSIRHKISTLDRRIKSNFSRIACNNIARTIVGLGVIPELFQLPEVPLTLLDNYLSVILQLFSYYSTTIPALL